MKIDLTNFIDKLSTYQEGLYRVGDREAASTVGTIISTCSIPTTDKMGFYVHMLKESGWTCQREGNHSEAKAWLYAATWLEEELYDTVAHNAHTTDDGEFVDD